jgi:hypothetical protein
LNGKNCIDYTEKCHGEPVYDLFYLPTSTLENSGSLYAGFANGTICQYDAQLGDKPTFPAANAPKTISQNGIYHGSPSSARMLFSPFPTTQNNRVSTVIKNPNNVDFVSACYDSDCQQYISADSLSFLYVW